MNIFAERLKELREENNLNQTQLAKALGVSVACVNRWEKSVRVPDINSIIVICNYFGCSSDYLLGINNLK